MNDYELWLHGYFCQNWVQKIISWLILFHSLEMSRIFFVPQIYAWRTNPFHIPEKRSASFAPGGGAKPGEAADGRSGPLLGFKTAWIPQIAAVKINGSPRWSMVLEYIATFTPRIAQTWAKWDMNGIFSWHPDAGWDWCPFLLIWSFHHWRWYLLEMMFPNYLLEMKYPQ